MVKRVEDGRIPAFTHAFTNESKLETLGYGRPDAPCLIAIRTGG